LRAHRETQVPTSRPILYFDLGSPYGYLAFERAAAVLGRQPELEPVLLGAIFAKRGFGSWAATSAREGRIADIQARAERYGLPPLRWPEDWPPEGLLAMRCATWAKRQGAVEQFARAVFRAEFQRGLGIADPATLAACAGEAGVDAEAMARAVTQPEVKEALRRATEDAWEAGVRGIPSLRVGESIFYGDDQLELAAAIGDA
jgi:2-hydroxychromene-2-carboxylate isomerase